MAKSKEYIQRLEIAEAIEDWLSKESGNSLELLSKRSGVSVLSLIGILEKRKGLLSLFYADRILLALDRHPEDCTIMKNTLETNILGYLGETDVGRSLMRDLKNIGYKLRFLPSAQAPSYLSSKRIETVARDGELLIFAPLGANQEDIFWHTTCAYGRLLGFPSDKSGLKAQALLQAWSYAYCQKNNSDRSKLQLRRIWRKADSHPLSSEETKKASLALWSIASVYSHGEQKRLLAWLKNKNRKLAEGLEQLFLSFGHHFPTSAKEASLILEDKKD